MKILILGILANAFAFGACVQERQALGSDLIDLFDSESVYALQEDGTYEQLSEEEVIPFKLYSVQILPKKEALEKGTDPFDRYNRRYIKYYTYPRMTQFLQEVSEQIQEIGYKKITVGKSLAGRNLYYIGPKDFDPNKKTIVMFGRHHGDEGTANWIIEGFLKKYLSDKSFSDEFQLLLYPMINPDGAMDHIRYNKNGRDLNRSWSSVSGKDEIISVHGHLQEKLKSLKKVVIALDMHGSFREDFIYRVKKGFKGEAFYKLQQKFIDELGAYDPWQAGNFILSNGHPGMARIVLINHYHLHALTHESIRDIPLRNSRGRELQDLILQGEAIVKAIRNLY